MALEKLTKIDGGGISTTSDYRVGVITATKFVGPVEGSITATDASFSGNVSIGGTLTYEDVTNIDSVGLVTARNGIEVSTGTATTALVVSGDARVTGILTVGTGSLTLDGPNNLVNVGTALTLGHTQGLQFHTQNLHSAGFEVNQINTSGIITATGADINGDLDVDGHTNLDNLSVAGVSTFSDGKASFDALGNLSTRYINLDQGNGIKYIDANLANGNSISLRGYIGGSYHHLADFTRGGLVRLNYNGNGKLETSGIGVTVYGQLDTTDLDVDGHTNLDNVSIAGVTTFASNVNLGDNDKLIIGDHGDIQIYNDGSTSVIENGGYSLGGNNNSLHIYSLNDILHNSTYSQYFHCGAANKSSTSPIQLGLIRNAGVKAYYNSNLKLETSPNGVDITGGLTVSGIVTFNQNVIIPDNKKILFGTDDDLQIYHDTTYHHGFIKETGSGGLIFATSVLEVYNAGVNEKMITANQNAGIELYYNNLKRFETTSAGADFSLASGGQVNLYHLGSDGGLRISGPQSASSATLLFNTNHQNVSGGTDYYTITCSGANHTLKFKRGDTSGNTVFELDDSQHVRIPQDGKALKIGAGQDLQLQHDGSDSLIANTTGVFFIQNTGDLRIRVDDTDAAIHCVRNGAVELYHNNDRVFFTETRGVRIGDATKIYENSTHNTAVIQNTDIHHSIILRGSSNAAGTTITAGNTTTFREYGSFVFRTGAINAQERFIIEAGGTCKFIKGVEGGTDEDIAKFIPDGAVELYHNGTKRFFTYSDGVHIDTGVLRGDDNAKIALGSNTNGDLQIYHNGSDSYIDCPSSGSGHLIIKADDFLVRASNNEDMIKAIENAQVELYHNNIKKLSTISTGIEIHANEANNANIYMTADEGDDNGDQWILQSQASTNNFNFYNNTSGSAALKLSIKPDGDVGFYGNIRVPDDKQLKLGAGDDLRLYHRSSDNVSIIQELGSSYLSIQTNGNKLEFWDGANGNIMAEFFTGGGAYLRHGTTTRFNTTSTGTKTTGVHEVTGLLNLPTSEAGITFGPGTAANDRAHIEWRGGDNAGYLRISVDDDADTSGTDEHIEFGDYSTQNRGGTFTQHVKIARGQFLVRTGAHNVTQADRLNIDHNGNCNIYGHLVLGAGINITGNNQTSGITKSGNGFQFGPNNEHYLYQSATNEIALRISSDGPYAVFEDYSGDVMMGSNSGNLHIASGGNSRILVTGSNTQFEGDIYLSGELNMTNGGNKNRFIDCSMDDGESLIIRSTQGGDTGHENMATFTRNGACSFHFDASSDFKFQTASHGMNVHGDIHIGGQNTSTNQNRKIYWTGFDKEGSTDLSDTAEIRHAQNIHGIAGSVLEIEAQNDANDGIALNASDGAGIIAAVCKKFDVTGYIEPSPGGGDNGIKWQDDPYGGSGDIATMQYYQDGSGENTRLRILVANDADDDLRLEASTVHVQGSFSAATNKGFRIPHPLVGLTTMTDLVHTAVEGPQADLIYRGRAKLVAGISTVNIDATNNMTDGTFVNLNRDVQCFTSNETGWTAVKGSVTGNLLTIIAQDNTCTDTISWMVVGERWDLAMYDPKNPMTAENGKIKTEIPNSNYNKSGFVEDYIHENKYRVGISTFSRPSIENKEVE